MKSKKTQFIMLAIVPLAALLLSGCGKQTDKSPKSTIGAPETGFNTPNPALKNSGESTDISTVKLDPLPADNKQAIDKELSDIDKDLKATDNAINSTDLSDANLGL